MKQWLKWYGVHLVISIAALLLAAVHVIFPGFLIDTVTLVLVAIAVLPWLGSIFKSIEFPGGGKVEYQDLRKARRKSLKLVLSPTKKERRTNVRQ